VGGEGALVRLFEIRIEKLRQAVTPRLVMGFYQNALMLGPKCVENKKQKNTCEQEIKTTWIQRQVQK
jgi:hypothetical protein